MLKNIFARLKGKQEKTSNDVNALKESGKKKPEDMEK
jgi:hypothetical protein